MRLSNLTWPKAEEYFRAHDTVLIGIGSIECHGRHMPLGTDTPHPRLPAGQDRAEERRAHLPHHPLRRH